MAAISFDTLQYIETDLPQIILNNNEELKNKNVESCKATNSKSFDGFMSSIFTLELKLKDKLSGRSDKLNLIVKIMKDIPQFLELTKMDLMALNELKFYGDILPFYQQFLLNNKSSVNSDWTPKFYYGSYVADSVEASTKPNGIFVFENLTASKYRLGPREKLDEKHITIMVKELAKFHAVSFALKIQNNPKFAEFVDSLKKIPFYTEGRNMNNIFYDITLERLMNHIKSTEESHDKKFVAEFTKIFKKYIEVPSKLMQEFLVNDETFSIIIHGDYNRNNVMFKYDSAEGFENPQGMKMFDFQLTKYASLALDLSFCLYMNLDPAIRSSVWEKMLKVYHKTLIESLANILKCNESDDRLKPFSYINFINHFKKYAFYGVMIAAWFLPVMLSDLERCKMIESEFEKDFFSAKSKEVTMPAGGIEAAEIITDIVKHAHRQGYMQIFTD